MISEEMLRTAAEKSRTAFVECLEQDYDPAHPHTFTPAFETKIKKLCRRANHPVLYHSLRRAASVLLAMLVGASVWLTVDIEARAAFVQWVREMYEESILYRYFNAPQDGLLPTYEITALPDGYTLADSITDETSCIQIFENGKSGFLFVYYFISSDTQNELFIFDDYTYEPVIIEELSADYYTSINPNETNELLWFDEETGVAFQLSAFLDKTEMVKIAASVTRQKN